MDPPAGPVRATRVRQTASGSARRRQQSTAAAKKQNQMDKYLTKPTNECKENKPEPTTAEPKPQSKLAKTMTSSKSSSHLQKSKVLNPASVLTAQTDNNADRDETDKQQQQPQPENLNQFYKNYYTKKNTRWSWSPNSNLIETPLPNLTWANSLDLWAEMKRKEHNYVHDASYMKRHVGLEPQMRAILLDWLLEIAQAYRLHRETVHLAIEYIDRFMTLTKRAMRIDRLQLIGMTALFLAAKVEEIYPPKLKEFAAHMDTYSSDNEDAISKFELFMLKTLNWEISPVTANTWLMTYLQIACINHADLIDKYHKCGSSDQAFNELELEYCLFEEPLSSQTGKNTRDEQATNSATYKTSIVMPLNVYKNSELTLKTALERTSSTYSSQFYTDNYLRAVTLLDLCMFDMESLRYNYSVLAAAAVYHTLTSSNGDNTKSSKFAAYLVEKSTGYKMIELDLCLKWMSPYAEVCNQLLTQAQMSQLPNFSNVDSDDQHNIQLYYEFLDLLVSPC